MGENGMTPEMFQQLYSKPVQERLFKAVYDAVLRVRKEKEEEKENEDET